MKKSIIYLLCLLVGCLASCTQEAKFKVDGNITDAEGKILILEAMDINGAILLDSVKLKKEGNFTFAQKAPESPEFYRLRIENKTINFSVDSTETVTFNAPFEQLSTRYTVENSENSQKIKELTLTLIELQQQLEAFAKKAKQDNMPQAIYQDSLASIVDAYKYKVKREYIFAAPDKTYAYYALFQKINNYMLFDPLSSKDDIKAFAAVATSLNNAYPHADRSRNLYNMVIKGMKNTRTPQPVKESDLPEITETHIIEVALKDMKGIEHKLTETKGKVVLLDFTVYQNAASINHNFALRELYDKYAASGFEIFQVSLDADEHFWRTVADNLPWICVRDPNGIYSTIAAAYNVQKVPTYFLVNKKNELSDRDENIKNLESEIKKLLSQR